MTQHYVGTKIVLAWPATDRKGEDARGGYAMTDEDGYTSWSPTEAFEAAYLPLGHIGDLPPHVQRLKAEAVQLADRLAKLQSFLASETFAGLPADDKNLLREQASAMTHYTNVLSRRLVRAGCATA